jgi:hypothetical protein
MNNTIRIIRRWLARLLVVIGIIVGLQLSVLAFPYPFFPHKAQFENCTVYSDVDMSGAIDDIMAGVDTRLRQTELFTSSKHNRVFICHNRSLFSFFARLSLLNPHIQGFGLSLFGNSFISVSRVRQLGHERGGWPPYSIVDGGIVHVIVHEIVHEYIADELGFFKTKRTPPMKLEGYVEYNTHRAFSGGDSTHTFFDRIAILENNNNWYPNDYIRSVYRATLVVEYLSEIRGYRFADIMHDSLVIESAYCDMLVWYTERMNTSGSK